MVVRRTIAPVAPLIVVLLAATLSLAGCGEERSAPQARLSVVESLGDGDGSDLEGYARATEVRPFRFPADHGPHPDFRTEWWYFTGNLEGEDGRRFGYQLTFFRTAVAPPETTGVDGPASGGWTEEEYPSARGGLDAAEPSSAWRTRQVYMAHFALTDAEGDRFLAEERFARGAAGLAGAEAEPFRVWTGPWSATSAGDETTFPLRLRAETGDATLDLTVEAGDGWVAQGDRGLSRKGEAEGNASYYYSYPRMPTRGTLTVEGETFTVAGDSWLDREWSTSLLGPGQVGWDWFSLQLDDGSEVVAFRLRDADDPPLAAAAPLGYAALMPADATPAGAPGSALGSAPEGPLPLPLRLLDADRAALTVTGRWRSPWSGITWPSGWRLVLPDAGLDLTLQPILADQELNLAFLYWEGAVKVEGTRGGQPVEGYGYAELTGYGESSTPAK